jgi:hypothetical protein
MTAPTDETLRLARKSSTTRGPMTRREEIWQQIGDIWDQIWDLEYQADHLETELEALDETQPEGNDDDGVN